MVRVTTMLYKALSVFIIERVGGMRLEDVRARRLLEPEGSA